MKRRGIIALSALAIVLIAAGAAARAAKAWTVVQPPSAARAPDSVRVRVQVLNATKTRGLARRATMLLRDRGFDVVETGTVNDARDTTVVLDLSGHPEWAKRVARIMAPARVESRPDTSRYLDIAVVLGASWRAPAEPFHP